MVRSLVDRSSSLEVQSVNQFNISSSSYFTARLQGCRDSGTFLKYVHEQDPCAKEPSSDEISEFLHTSYEKYSKLSDCLYPSVYSAQKAVVKTSH